MMETNEAEVYYASTMCPLCKQGCQVVFKEVDNGTLFIYCDECESEWLDIDKISDTNSIVHRNGFGKPADKSDLESHPWRHKILNWASDNSKPQG